MKFYSIEDWGGHGSMSHLLMLAGHTEVHDPQQADMLVFNGGADIGTEIYGEEPVFRGIPQFRSSRDKREIALYNGYIGKKFMLGICRGAQLLNCLNGGTLWQHVNNHGRDHIMTDLITGKKYTTTSTHHQMMRPTEEAKLIAVANEAETKHSAGTVKAGRDGEDIEVVWYPATRSLCIQGHPEYVPHSEFADYCLDMINEYSTEAKNAAA